VHARGEGNGIVPKEQDLPVSHILGSQGRDHGEYCPKLESVDVLTEYPVGDYVGVEGQRDARGAANTETNTNCVHASINQVAQTSLETHRLPSWWSISSTHIRYAGRFDERRSI
jgi:hypothetical protein